MDSWLALRPSLIPQNTVKDLADCGLWQTVSELDFTRHFELGQPSLAVLDEVLGCDRCTLLKHQEGFNCFAPVWVRDCHHRRLHQPRDQQQRIRGLVRLRLALGDAEKEQRVKRDRQQQSALKAHGCRARQTFSEVSGISRCSTPRSCSASSTACTTAGTEPIVLSHATSAAAATPAIGSEVALSWSNGDAVAVPDA